MDPLPLRACGAPAGDDGRAFGDAAGRRLPKRYDGLFAGFVPAG